MGEDVDDDLEDDDSDVVIMMNSNGISNSSVSNTVSSFKKAEKTKWTDQEVS